MTRGRARSTGFTLLEVLIALLVLSLALVALVRVAGLQAEALVQLRASTLAQWVAANVAAETRLQDEFPAIGRSQGEMQMGEQRWRWQMDVAATDEAEIRRMDIAVYPAELRTEDPVAVLTAFASQ